MPPTEATAVRALVVEDEAPLRDELCEALAAAWPALDIVDTAADGETALRLVEQHAPDLLFLDIRIPDPDGLEVARLVAEGLSNKQIGARLFISDPTVATHIRNIMNKLGVNSRAQIASWITSSNS